MTGRTLVVTGTDTGIGKTLVSCAVIRQARAQGVRVCGFKPVATGCGRTPQGLRNADALAMQRVAGTRESYEMLNPYAFEPPVAPSIAAAESGVTIDTARLDAGHAELVSRHQLVVIEGLGGWLTPLDRHVTFGDWASRLGWPALLVVGMRLGCLNQALLAASAITRRTKLIGWVANVLPPAMERLEQNIDELNAMLGAPCWGVVPPGGADFADPAAAGETLRAFLR